MCTSSNQGTVSRIVPEETRGGMASVTHGLLHCHCLSGPTLHVRKGLCKVIKLGRQYREKLHPPGRKRRAYDD